MNGLTYFFSSDLALKGIIRSEMNVFRMIGDSSHLMAIVWLLTFMLMTKSCRGYSGKTQMIYLTVFVFRYIDLFTNFISVYNSVMKAIFILAKATILFLMFGVFRETRQKQHDTFRYFFFLFLLGLAIRI